MTTQTTIATYQAGNPQEAYKMFINDETANDGVSFSDFCDGMDRILASRKELELSANGHSVNFL